jgi:cyclase
MVKTRLIPVLLLKGGMLVRSEAFKTHQIIGFPLHEVKRFNEWNVDELIYLDITREGETPQARPDHIIGDFRNKLEILDAVSQDCFMPLTWGGRLRCMDDLYECFSRGADKITLNTMAFRTPGLVSQAAYAFGSQAVVASVDALLHADGRYEVMIENGTTPTGLDPVAWAKQLEDLGAGEILLQAIHRDGTGEGYDLDLIRAVSAAVSIPVIALSGVGRFEDYAAGVRAGAAAVAAANIWHFKELADRQGKRALARAGVNVRMLV